MRRQSWLLASAGLAAALAILITGVYSSGAYKLIHLPARQQALDCMPSNFPTYGGMTIVAAGYQRGVSLAPSDSTSCNMTWNSKATYSDVEAFYRKALSSGDWATNSLSGGQESREIQFYLIDRPDTQGWASISRTNVTVVEVRLFS